MYPAYLSGRTIDESIKVSRRVKGSTINLGSFAVPVTLLGLGDKPKQLAIPDEQKLQVLSLTLHKLAAYWTVQGCISVVETVLFVPTVLPFYLLLKLGLSVWLVFPLLSGTTVSNTWDIEDEWKLYSRSGAGLVFERFVLPLVSTEEPTSDSPVDVIVQYVRKLFALVDNLQTQQRLWLLMGTYMATSQLDPQPEAKNDNDDDYDVVDKPLPSEVAGLTQRKKGWLW